MSGAKPAVAGARLAVAWAGLAAILAGPAEVRIGPAAEGAGFSAEEDDAANSWLLLAPGFSGERYSSMYLLRPGLSN